MTQENQDQPIDPIIEIPDSKAENVPLWAAATSAGKESRKWDNWEELNEIKRHNDKRWLKHYGVIILLITWTFSLLFLAALVIWALHHLLGEYCHWLDEQRLNKIQSTLFSGGMGAIVAGILKNQLGKV